MDGMKLLGLVHDLFLDLSLLCLLGCLELLSLLVVFPTDRLLSSCRHYGTLNIVFQDTSYQYKEQYLHIKLCASL